jgi:hypothetical protein
MTSIRRRVAISVLIALALVGLGFFFYYKHITSSSSEKNIIPPTFREVAVSPTVLPEEAVHLDGRLPPQTSSTEKRRAFKNPVRKLPAQMSDEEARLIDESFAITASMTTHLDDGDHLQAIYEARTLLEHPNREVRLDVVRALSWIGLPGAMDLAKMIDDRDSEIRNEARDAFWDALEDANDPLLKRNLLAEALLSGDPEVRREVLDVLIFLPDVISFPVLAFAMDDPDTEVAELAAENASFASGGEEFTSRDEAERWFDANKSELDLE